MASPNRRCRRTRTRCRRRNSRTSSAICHRSGQHRPRRPAPVVERLLMKLKLAIIVLLAAASLQAQVTFDRILHGDKEPQNWLSYSGTLMNQRFSPLTQITTANVKNLQQAWIWQARSLEKFEATPLVVDGVL